MCFKTEKGTTHYFNNVTEIKNSPHGLKEEITRKLHSQPHSLHTLSNGEKVFWVNHSNQLKGGMFCEPVTTVAACVQGVIAVVKVVKSVIKFCKWVRENAGSCYQKIKNWFKGHGFKDDQEIKNSDVHRMLDCLSSSEKKDLSNAVSVIYVSQSQDVLNKLF